MVRQAAPDVASSGASTGPRGRGGTAGELPRAPGAAVWAVLWAATIVAEALALKPVLFGAEPVQGLAVVFALVGGSFAASGLVAWRRRPDSRSGMLMTATGFAFFIGPLLGQLDAPLAATARVLTVDWWIFLFVPLILTLLTRGRLHGALDKGLVASFAVPLVLLQVAWMMLDPEEGELLLAFPDASAADVLDTTQRALLAASAVVTAAVVGDRWWSAGGPRRRALLPSLAGAFVLLLFVALLLNDLITGSRSEPLLWIAACSLVTVPLAFLAALLRSRLARGGLADLLLAVGSTRGGALRDVLARTLGDPGLVVGYWLPDYRAYADADGRRIELPAPGGERSMTTVDRDGEQVAALVYDASLDDDPQLVEAITAAAAIALENEHLHAEAQARLSELRASRERIVAAGDAERRRLERNLHDGAQQRLVGIALHLRLLQARLAGDPSAEELAERLSEELALSLAELRELARGIHPAVLEHGLPAALEALAARSQVPVTVTCRNGARLTDTIELAAYFVVSEALANVVKYANASHADVRFESGGGRATITISDDGVGGADDARGTGLRGLADRVEALDGTLRVVSPSGAGTTVTAELPCA
jgi:signal transduction histidine kinase